MTTAVRFSEEATSKYAQAGDIRIHYNEVGEGDAVIFLHGGGPGATSWSNFFKNVGVVSEQYRCLLVDQPGFGKSDSVTMTEPRSTVNARAIRDLMDVLTNWPSTAPTSSATRWAALPPSRSQSIIRTASTS